MTLIFRIIIIIKSIMNSGEFSQASKVNQQFRKEIRRKDIDRRLAERRKQLLDQQKTKAKIQINGLIQEFPNSAPVERDRTKFQQIYQSFVSNGRKLSQKNVRDLAEISCSLAGSQIIIGSQRDFLEYLVKQFIMNEKYAQSLQLDWVLLIFNNCLTVSSPNYSQEGTISLANSNFLIHTLSSSSLFLERIFALAVQSTKNSIKQNSMSVIFDIIYNSQSSFICTLVTNPKYLIINVLFNQMHTEPSKNVVVQTLRCYFLIMRKLDFAGFQQFGKMRKFLIMVIRNSNCFELTFLGILCLHSLLRCLPTQRATFSKANMLGTIYNQTLSLNNCKLASQTIKLASLMLQNKNQQQIRHTVNFIEQGLQKFVVLQFYIFSFKILYDIIVNSLYQVDKLISEHQKLFNKMMQLFQSNQTNKEVMIEVTFCIVILTVKSRNVEKNQTYRIRNRVKNVVENYGFDEKTVRFLQQSLEMLDSQSFIQP